MHPLSPKRQKGDAVSMWVKEGNNMIGKHISKLCCLIAGTVCINSIAFANVPYDKVSIGGVGPGSSIGYVKSIYGEPSSTNYDTPTSATYEYGNSFVLTSNPKDSQTIYTVFSSAHNGLNTPDGVGVGMKESVLEEKYGPCERIGNVDGVTYYHYAMDPNPSLPNAFGGYSFGVKDGIIISIWAGVVASEDSDAETAPAETAASENTTTDTKAESESMPQDVTEAAAQEMSSHNVTEKEEPSPSSQTPSVTTKEGTTVTIEKE